MSAPFFCDPRFARTLPARGLEPASRGLSRVGERAAHGGDRRVLGTPFDPLPA